LRLKVLDDKAFIVMKGALKKSKEGVRLGLVNVAPEIKREVRRLIRDPNKTGRIYNINGKRHQASAPGEAPANLTGKLARSVGSSISGYDTLVIGERGHIAPYAKYLEYGSPEGKILKRPHLRPAVISKAREIEQSIIKGIKDTIG